MKISEIKKWAKSHGYHIEKTKTEIDNVFTYAWFMIDNEQVNGTETSVSKVATAIFNHITNNAHVEYQREYKTMLVKQDIKHEVEGW